MTLFLALLRGINVGPRNQVKMADLQQACTALGLQKVETYIRSGNVIFTSPLIEPELHAQLETHLAETFGFPILVLLRTAAEIARIVADCPYSPAEQAAAQTANQEGESFYVSLFATEAPAEILARLEALRTPTDDFRLQGRELYLLLRHSIRNSKLAAALPQIWGTSTVRNWNTLTTLHGLLQLRSTQPS
jgi:uncharacterized protein (DUF1697 family)